MPDPGFEQYLETLTHLLRLNKRERDDIRRELAAHVEEFIEEEIARGATRKAAVDRAIEDFGDAAALAARFHHTDLRKRWLMRGTAAAAVAGFAFVSYSYFGGPRLAQSAAGDANTTAGGQAHWVRADATGGGAAPASADSERDARTRAADEQVEAALQRVLPDAHFKDIPLADALAHVQELMGANVVVYWRDLEGLGIERDQTVSLSLKNTTVERVLELILDDVASQTELGFAIRDGVLVVGPQERIDRRLEVAVYDVTDLIARTTATNHAGRYVPAPGTPSTPGPHVYRSAPLPTVATTATPATEATIPAAQPGAEGRAPASGGASVGTAGRSIVAAPRKTTTPEPATASCSVSSDDQPPAPMRATISALGPFAVRASEDAAVSEAQNELEELIEQTIRPESWADAGGLASIRFYNDVMVVRASSSMHRDLRTLLRQLGKVTAARAAGGATSAR